MLGKLAAIHPDLTRWHRQAQTKAAAYRPFCELPPRVDELEVILQQGRHFTSASRELVPALGYSAAAWNGFEEPRGLQFGLDVGQYPCGRLYPNEVSFEGLAQNNTRFVNAVILKQVLLTVAQCWQADWGVIETWAYKGLIEDLNQKPLVPYGGWLTYLSSEFAHKVSPPAGIDAEQLADGSLFMLVCDEQFDVMNPTHLSKLDAVQKALAPVQRSIGEAFRAAFPSTPV